MAEESKKSIKVSFNVDASSFSQANQAIDSLKNKIKELADEVKRINEGLGGVNTGGARGGGGKGQLSFPGMGGGGQDLGSGFAGGIAQNFSRYKDLFRSISDQSKQSLAEMTSTLGRYVGEQIKHLNTLQSAVNAVSASFGGLKGGFGGGGGGRRGGGGIDPFGDTAVGHNPWAGNTVADPYAGAMAKARFAESKGPGGGGGGGIFGLQGLDTPFRMNSQGLLGLAVGGGAAGAIGGAFNFGQGIGNSVLGAAKAINVAEINDAMEASTLKGGFGRTYGSIAQKLRSGNTATGLAVRGLQYDTSIVERYEGGGMGQVTANRSGDAGPRVSLWQQVENTREARRNAIIEGPMKVTDILERERALRAVDVDIAQTHSQQIEDWQASHQESVGFANEFDQTYQERIGAQRALRGKGAQQRLINWQRRGYSSGDVMSTIPGLQGSGGNLAERFAGNVMNSQPGGFNASALVSGYVPFVGTGNAQNKMQQYWNTLANAGQDIAFKNVLGGMNLQQLQTSGVIGATGGIGNLQSLAGIASVGGNEGANIGILRAMSAGSQSFAGLLAGAEPLQQMYNIRASQKALPGADIYTQQLLQNMSPQELSDAMRGNVPDYLKSAGIDKGVVSKYYQESILKRAAATYITNLPGTNPIRGFVSTIQQSGDVGSPLIQQLKGKTGKDRQQTILGYASNLATMLGQMDPALKGNRAAAEGVAFNMLRMSPEIAQFEKGKGVGAGIGENELARAEQEARRMEDREAYFNGKKITRDANGKIVKTEDRNDPTERSLSGTLHQMTQLKDTFDRFNSIGSGASKALFDLETSFIAAANVFRKSAGLPQLSMPAKPVYENKAAPRGDVSGKPKVGYEMPSSPHLK